MRLNPKVVQTIGAAIIPIMGFYFWNWDLYFILLYYFLDQLVVEFFMHVMSREIAVEHADRKTTWIKGGVISLTLYLSFVLFVHLTFLMLIPNIDFPQRIIEFLTYKDLGVEQWMLLFPLLVLVGYQRYNLEFKMRGGAKTFSMESIWKPHLFTNAIIVGFTLLVFTQSFAFKLSQEIYLWGIVLISSVYALFQEKLISFKPSGQ